MCLAAQLVRERSIVVISPENPELVYFSEARDNDLRIAHQQAFMKISQARLTGDYQAAVRTAVDELIDACEAYTTR